MPREVNKEPFLALIVSLSIADLVNLGSKDAFSYYQGSVKHGLNMSVDTDLPAR